MLEPEIQEQIALFLLAELHAEQRQEFEARRDTDPAVAEATVEANNELERIMQTLEPGVHRASEAVRQSLFARVAPTLARLPEPAAGAGPEPEPEPEPTAAPEVSIVLAEAEPAPMLAQPDIVGQALAGHGSWGFATIIAAVLIVAACAGWATPLLQSRAVVAADNSNLRSELSSAQSEVSSLQASREAAIRASQAENTRIIRELTERKVQLEQERDALRADLESTSKELVALQGGDHLSRLTVRVLQPAVAGDEEGGKPMRGLVVWDPSKQVGLLTLQNLPNLPADQECQLWVLDPAIAQPISLGVVPAASAGKRPTPLRAVQKLARIGEIRMTLEKRGGAAAPEGPTLLVSEK